jgi:POT family proton-dependent oligopeptide transporter
VYLFGEILLLATLFFSICNCYGFRIIDFFFTKNKLGPIGNSPLSHLPKTKRLTKEILVYALSLLSIPLIFIMVKNTDYTDYFMYTIGIIAIALFV